MRWQHCHDITSLEIALSAHRFFSFLSRCWCFPRGQRLTAVLSSNSSLVSGTYACDSRRWHHAGFPAVWTNDAGMTCVSGKGEAAHCAAAVWLTAPLFLLSPSVSWKVPFSLEFLSNLCCCITPTSWWVTPWACCWWQQTPSLALLGYITFEPFHILHRTAIFVGSDSVYRTWTVSSVCDRYSQMFLGLCF